MRRDSPPGHGADAPQPAVLLDGVRDADAAAGGGAARRRSARRRLQGAARVVRRGCRRVHAVCSAVSIMIHLCLRSKWASKTVNRSLKINDHDPD